ncbi:MAG: type I-MYXAN CRISPR-associated protein Cas5/Cmx5/DevS [Pseudomonadota bacterium]
MHDSIALYVSVPVASFRVPRAREYFETLPCPPPSTVYGMLLSLVGETNRHAHEGAEIAIALVSQPEYSVVLRTLWRVKSRKQGLGQGENKRPDFQELLTNVRIVVWVRRGAVETATSPLANRVQQAVMQPDTVSRFGGLSLGESTHLVDELRVAREEDAIDGKVLLQDESGELSLPIWPDHVGSRNTSWRQFTLGDGLVGAWPAKRAWVAIQREARLG